MKAAALALVGMIALFSPAVQAQSDPYPYGNTVAYPEILAKILAKPRQPLTDDEVVKFLGLSHENITKFATFAAGEQGYRRMLKAVEDARLDKQTGASPSSEGTTSLVSKGAVTQLLSLAVDEGALARSDNKTITTFSGNALGVGRFVASAATFPYCAVFDLKCGSKLETALEGLAFSFSLDTSPGSGTSTGTTSGSNRALLTGPAPKLSGWTLRYDFNVRRQAAAKDFVRQIQSQGVDSAANAYALALSKLLSGFEQNKNYTKWKDLYHDRLQSAQAGTPDGLEIVLAEALVDLVAIAKRDLPNFDTMNDDFLTAMGTYFGVRDRAVEALINRVTYSLEYDNEHPLNQPTQSNVKFILSARLDQVGKRQLTFNSTAAWYDHAPPQGAVRRFRDAQASLQLDFGLTPDSSGVGAALSAGYYFQWMADNALLTIPSGNLAPGTSIALPGDASVLLNTKGSVSIGQIEVTLNFKNGVKLPFAVSYANRTELLKASTVRGHFGLTYDLDSIFNGLTGK